jgi:hypothetical protein
MTNSIFRPDEKLETPDEMYEEWLLRWYEPLRDARKSWSLFGISVKESFDEKGFWGIDPNFVAQAEMKERHQYAAADKSESQHMEAMQKAIRAIPKHGGSQVDALLEERVNATTSARPSESGLSSQFKPSRSSHTALRRTGERTITIPIGW